MDFFNIEKVILLALIFVPGFVFLKAKKIFIAEHKTDFSKDLYEAVGISLINFVLSSPLIFYYYSNKNFVEDKIYLFLVVGSLLLLIIPLLESYLFSKIRRSKFLKKHFRTANKKPWDDFF